MSTGTATGEALWFPLILVEKKSSVLNKTLIPKCSCFFKSVFNECGMTSSPD